MDGLKTLSAIMSNSKLSYIDPNISVDLLLTSWYDRRVAEFRLFMRTTTSFDVKNISSYKTTKIDPQVEKEHKFVLNLLGAAKFY